MKRLIIIVEGDTESEFVDKTLFPYLNSKGVYNISCYKITKTNGGLTNYLHLKSDIINAVNEQNVLVTTLIDFYALPNNFPCYEEAQKIYNKDEKVFFLEESILKDIKPDGYLPQLYPYIQLHEFEALLFTDIKGFKNNFNPDEIDIAGIEYVLKNFSNPELINDNKDTAPSKRLKKLIPSYRKVVFGNIIIEDNGIKAILGKCPRFKNWIDTIISRLKE